MKLGLRTVRFGLDYDIKGEPMPSAGEVERILACAHEKSVAVLGAAPAQGDSEEIIGASLPDESSFRVITKTAPGLLATVSLVH